MNDTAAAEAALRKTLEKADIDPALARAPQIMDCSDATVAGNTRVHGSTNRLILELLDRGSLGNCMHITGDAAALVDPFHRQVCAAMQRRDAGRFNILYRLPQDRRLDSMLAVEWNLERWSRKGLNNWTEKFQTLDTVGAEAVDLRAYDTPRQLQYSVFGNRYVQLQEFHDDNARAKRVWLIDSSKLNDKLTERATGLFDAAEDVDERWFRDFTLLVSGILAKYILGIIRDTPGIDAAGLLGDPKLAYSPDDPTRVLRALELMGFVSNRDGRYSLTDSGTDFLRSI